MENKEIPGNLLRKWEISATNQNLSQSEFIIYIREREREYFESLETNVSPAIMENGQLTEYGEKKAIDHFRRMTSKERAIKMAKIDFVEYSDYISKHGVNHDVCVNIIKCFESFKLKMKDLRISKEDCGMYRMNLKEVRSMYFSAKKFVGA